MPRRICECSVLLAAVLFALATRAGADDLPSVPKGWKLVSNSGGEREYRHENGKAGLAYSEATGLYTPLRIHMGKRLPLGDRTYTTLAQGADEALGTQQLMDRTKDFFLKAAEQSRTGRRPTQGANPRAPVPKLTDKGAPIDWIPLGGKKEWRSTGGYGITATGSPARFKVLFVKDGRLSPIAPKISLGSMDEAMEAAMQHYRAAHPDEFKNEGQTLGDAARDRPEADGSITDDAALGRALNVGLPK